MPDPARADELDPEAAAVVESVEGLPEWHALSVKSARRLEADLFGATRSTPVSYTRDVAVDGPDGEIPLRVVRPAAAGTLPTVVFYHGGGWTLGTLDSVEDICREVAAQTPAVVLAVDYRLAPEHPFPAGLKDCVAAYEWTREHAAAFGGDPDRVAVAGTSAGGNLAAAVALYGRDFAAPEPDAQALLYPITDGSFDTDSYAENAAGPLLTRRDMEHFWAQYCPSPVQAANPYASVLRADLDGVAPALVATAGYDPLRDEGVAYADRLTDAGVPVEHVHAPALPHGFLSFTDDVTRARAVRDDVCAWLASTL